MTATRRKTTPPSARRAIQFKVQLGYVQPPIWRRVVVPEHATLGDLHEVIQIAMGWDDCHMHSFRIGGKYFTSQEAAAMEDTDMEDEERVPLAEVVTRAKQKFMYEYDFGDSWEHEIVAEKFLPRDATTMYPVCLDGARACPPEDCGGFPGYMNVIEALNADQPTEDQQELLEWVGEGYDPERFDLDAVNRDLTMACPPLT